MRCVLKIRLNLSDFFSPIFVLISICIAVIACSSSNDYREFSEAFELSAFLKTHIHKLPGQQVEFQILTMQGEPVPYGLLKFQWVDGGRMSFQTDQDGTLSMQFEKDMLENEVMVSPESADAKLRVFW